MHYIDVQNAGPIPGFANINSNRLALRWNGRETSANGTGPEETCMRKGGANRAACCRAFRSNLRTAKRAIPCHDPRSCSRGCTV